MDPPVPRTKLPSKYATHNPSLWSDHEVYERWVQNMIELRLIFLHFPQGNYRRQPLSIALLQRTSCAVQSLNQQASQLCKRMFKKNEKAVIDTTGSRRTSGIVSDFPCSLFKRRVYKCVYGWFWWGHSPGLCFVVL
jgi:hypothetical protein